MLTGEFESNLGDKNRIAIPKKLRDQFIGKVYITRGYENSLIMTDLKRWNEFESEVSKTSILDSRVREVKRFIIGGAYEIEYDNQGRFVLSQQLIEFASIKEKIVFVGIGNWVELWDQEIWKEKLKYLTEEVSSISQKLIET
jgi:MraZ protein